MKAADRSLQQTTWQAERASSGWWPPLHAVGGRLLIGSLCSEISLLTIKYLHRVHDKSGHYQAGLLLDITSLLVHKWLIEKIAKVTDFLPKSNSYGRSFINGINVATAGVTFPSAQCSLYMTQFLIIQRRRPSVRIRVLLYNMYNSYKLLNVEENDECLPE